MDTSDLRNWLRLSRLELAPKTAVGLVQHFGCPEAIFGASDTELDSLAFVNPRNKDKIHLPIPASVENDLQQLEQLKITLIPITSSDYPAPLKDIFDPPPVLYVKGTLQEKDKLSIAVVGSRRASPYGRAIAERITRELAAKGLAIISGGARGIDTSAHKGALSAGGRTIAVLGCGVNVNYPAENKQLFDSIVDNGAVISEFPLGSAPEPWRFPPRNRLISGMSIGVLVCQSPETSGALITASYAAEQGKDVYAVPGNVDDERNKGCHKLIKDGAKLIENASDILSELGIDEDETTLQPKLPMQVFNDQENKILALLSLDPVPIDEIIDKTGIPANVVSGTLTLLEMKGAVRRVPGNAYIRNP